MNKLCKLYAEILTLELSIYRIYETSLWQALYILYETRAPHVSANARL